MFEIVIMI